MKCCILSLILLLLCVLVFCEEDKENDAETFSGSRDQDGWVDPHDMVDEQDTGFRSWLKKSVANMKGLDILNSIREKNAEDALSSAFSNLQDELNDCRKELQTAASLSCQDGLKEVASCDTPYFKQLVRVIHEATSDVRPQTEIRLSTEHRETLKMFLNNEANVHDVMTILLENITNKTISDSFIDKYIVFISTFLNTETIVLLTCLMLLVTIVIIFEMTSKLTARQQFVYLIVIAFIISIPWEWFRLYKKEFAKKQSIMMEKLQKNCHSYHELGPVESMSLWWKSVFSTVDNSCAKYHEALLVDAIWEVAPSKAVSVTLTRFFVEPLEHIADATGKSFRALFQHLPIQWQPLMFLACLLIIILCIILVSGLRISTPLFKIGVGHEHTLANEQLLRIDNQMQELRQVAENRNIPAIENVEGNDQRMQAVFDIARAINERSVQQEEQLREMRESLQELRVRAVEHCRQAEAVEHQDWEVVDRTRVAEERGRLRQPVQASEHHPTENIGPGL